MTGTWHPTPAERLLALLDDDSAFETLPSEEVRADLDAAGVDPSRCVALARALAGGTGSPGGQLLGAIDMAEDEADEIARLESASIDTVRAQIPGASAAAIAAEARRQAGGDSNIVAMKPRRRGRILLWGGPVAGIAASVLLLIVIAGPYLGNEIEDTFDTTSSYLGPASGGESEKKYSRDEADTPVARNAAPEAEKKKTAAERGSEASADSLAQLERAPVEAPALAPAPPAGLVGGATGDVTVLESRSKEQMRQRGAGVEMAESAAEPEAYALKTRPAEEVVESKPGGDIADLQEGGAVAATIAAVVIVDPSQVSLAVQSRALPQPDLAARIDEARRLAGGRPVIALYTVETATGRQDFAQVPLELAMTQQMPAPTPLTQLLGPAAFEYDFLALPTE